jgi:hypothetical protein
MSRLQQNLIQTEHAKPAQEKALDHLISQLRHLHKANNKLLEKAGSSEDLNRVLQWSLRAENGDIDAKEMLKYEGFDLLKLIQARLQLTGQDYMTLEDESPARILYKNADPQKFFHVRDEVLKTIKIIEKLKAQDNWHESTLNDPALHLDIVHEAVGIFDDENTLQAAMDDLEEHGFMRHELSLLADDATIEEKLGHVYKRVALAQDDPAAPRTIFIPKETRGDAQGALIAMPLYIAASTASAVVVASGGTILSALAAASAAGAVGTAIGAALANFVAKHHASYILSQMERGGLLLWVNLRSPEQEELAKKILKRHSAHNVHTHKIPLYG